MKKMLIIAEKPSVSKAIAKVAGAYQNADGYMEGEDTVVSWCYGHLAEYAPPDAYDPAYARWSMEDLPIVPAQWQMAVAEDKQKQFDTLKMLLHREDTGFVVNACDAGREGELIFWNVYELAGCTLPVKRLWTSSLEQQAIEAALSAMKDASAYHGLRLAAVCRARADWLVGMNATRGFSVQYGTKLLIGRVQSPTLAMITKRQDGIDSFVKQPYYRADMVLRDGIAAVSDSFSNESDCDMLVEQCRQNPAIVSGIVKTMKRKNPPELFDLTSLQREANRRFGYTAKETLDALQELYEAKLVTYPRTDSRYLTSDMADSVLSLLDGMAGKFRFAASGNGRDVQGLIRDDRVTDHHALIPTMESLAQDTDGLPDRQRMLYGTIAARLFAAVSPACITEETCVSLLCGNAELSWKGSITVEEGYKAAEKAFDDAFFPKNDRKQSDPSSKTTDDTARFISGLSKGMQVSPVSVEKTTHYTQPPKPYTEDTLLSAMEQAGRRETDNDVERKGIGTPATRAAVIEKLVSSGYVRRQGKKLVPTGTGRMLVSILPEKLASPALTAEWENRLLEVERGRADAGEFLNGIIDEVKEMAGHLANMPEEERSLFLDNASLGSCPNCGHRVTDGKFGPYCTGHCGLTFNVFGSPLSGDEAESLLSGNPVKVKRKSRRTGKMFSVSVHPDGIEPYAYGTDDGTKSGFRFRTEFLDSRKKRKR